MRTVETLPQPLSWLTRQVLDAKYRISVANNQPVFVSVAEVVTQAKSDYIDSVKENKRINPYDQRTQTHMLVKDFMERIERKGQMIRDPQGIQPIVYNCLDQIAQIGAQSLRKVVNIKLGGEPNQIRPYEEQTLMSHYVARA